jgi:hypothetical protein
MQNVSAGCRGWYRRYRVRLRRRQIRPGHSPGRTDSLSGSTSALRVIDKVKGRRGASAAFGTRSLIEFPTPLHRHRVSTLQQIRMMQHPLKLIGRRLEVSWFAGLGGTVQQEECLLERLPFGGGGEFFADQVARVANCRDLGAVGECDPAG